jgi:hypothetical protein
MNADLKIASVRVALLYRAAAASRVSTTILADLKYETQIT